MKFKLPWWLRMTRVLVAYYFTFIFLAGYALAGVLREMWGYVVLVAACEVTRNYFAAGSIRPRTIFRLRSAGEQQDRSKATEFPCSVKVLAWLLILYLIPLSFGFPGEAMLDLVGQVEWNLTAPMLNVPAAARELQAVGQESLFPHYRHAYTVWFYGSITVCTLAFIHSLRCYHGGAAMPWEQLSAEMAEKQKRGSKIIAFCRIIERSI